MMRMNDFPRLLHRVGLNRLIMVITVILPKSIQYVRVPDVSRANFARDMKLK